MRFHRRSLMFAVICLAIASPAFADAQTSSKSATPTMPSDQSFHQRGYGVQYSVVGVLEIQDNVVTLHTDDARVFTLSIPPKKAMSWAGRIVKVDGLAHQADDVEYLKVKKITPVSADPNAHVELPPYKGYQKPAALLSRNGDTFRVANIRWDIAPAPEKGSNDLSFGWRNVTIRADRVKNVYFVKKPFPPEWIAAHSLMLFTFDKGGMLDDDGRESSAMALSVEAYQRVDQEYGLIDGMKRQFGVIWLLTTWNNYIDQTCLYGSGKLSLYQVRLNDEQKKRLVCETIEQAVVNREGEFYHTITNNCTNNLVILLNKVLEPERRIKMWTLPSFIYNFRATMPVWVPPMLAKRGIIGTEFPVIDSASCNTDWARNPELYTGKR